MTADPHNASAAPASPASPEAARAVARFVRDRMPAEGLFAGYRWRTALRPFPLGEKLAAQLADLGRVLLQFYRAANRLYYQSAEGGQPAWVAALLDQGKPAELIARQRAASQRQALPRVIRPDVLLTPEGFVITELDSVPGGIGLTAWLNQTYARLGVAFPESAAPIGGAEGMIRGFENIFGAANHVHIAVSPEASTYRPEMEWLCRELEATPEAVRSPRQSPGRFRVRDVSPEGVAEGDAVYRFFELFDLPNLPRAGSLFDLAAQKKILLTPPPKPILEEKMLFALLWNRNLREFWRRELGERFLEKLLGCVPRTWILDPAPLPPHAAMAGLELTDWRQLKALSQRERDLIVKISGFSELAWGARGVYLGSDLSREDWSVAVDTALSSFPTHPYVLQRYHRPETRTVAWFDPERDQAEEMAGRVRLCPYYFIAGENDAARATLGGVLATICPADKKIIHGMSDAVLAPCGL